MRLLVPGCLLLVLFCPVVSAAGGAASSYGLGEPEPLDSSGAAAQERAVVSLAESVPPVLSPAEPEAVLAQPFRIRLSGAAPSGRIEVIPSTAGLRYQPSARPR